MKKVLLLLLCLVFQAPLIAQTLEMDLKTFNKVVVSPYIEVELRQGDSESIAIYYRNIDEDELNVEVKGKTLQLYLDHAKFNLGQIFKHSQWDYDKMYKHADVKAVITYKSLKNIQIKGEESLVCTDPIEGKRLKIKIFGENEVRFASIDSDRLKVAVYGDNKLEIESGKSDRQVLKAYGDNHIDTHKVKTDVVRTGLYGDNEIDIMALHAIKIVAFGDGSISVKSDPYVHKRLILGDPDIYISR